ncbi:carbohydrate porin [Methylocystis sp. FS]|uniref:porin n=1 Tax=Methylocystis silviterrae TaxID=2743612 RepID=UPI0015816F62|nr:porin [Methylocystis silviterrae]NUJ80856.1 carbohydrate porin [Methylocystis silviterrae]
MAIRREKQAVILATLGALLSTSAGASDSAIEARLRMLEAEIARLRPLEAEVAKLRQEARQSKSPSRSSNSKGRPQQSETNIANAAASKGSSDTPPRPPVFVSFKNGLFVETEDKAYSFKVGGRIIIDGGGIALPLNGFDNQVGGRQLRLEVEGKAAQIYFYKLQYDFTGTSQITGVNHVYGGIRDAYFGIQSPLFTLPFAKEPAYVMVGSMFEPFSVEAINSSKYRDFIERSLAVDTFQPDRHIGLAMGAYGDDWTFKGGIFSTSFGDASLNPARGYPATWGIPRLYIPNAGGGAPFPSNTTWFQATGGGQYFDVTGRLTYAPIHTEHDLLHVGASGRYHQPNDSTAVNNDRVLALGNRIRSEANILGQGLIGTPDLSCGTIVGPIPQNLFNSSAFAGKCTKSVESFGVELAASHGPFGIQAEYFGAFYNRDQNAINRATYLTAASAATGAIPVNGSLVPFNPGGRSAYFDGYYIQGTYWITGEERAQSYDIRDKNGATFNQLKIKNPLSAGGYGAWGLAARFSSVDLNNGPYNGNTLYNLLALTTFVTPNPFARTYIANAGINGGRQQNLTIGVNWYPDGGVAFQANWTRVMNIVAPLNLYNGGPLPTLLGANYTGAHPNLFEVRAKVYW